MQGRGQGELRLFGSMLVVRLWTLQIGTQLTIVRVPSL